MRTIPIIFILFISVCFMSCEETVLYDEPITYDMMIGTWYLIDRGPNLDSTITACEKREYLVFRTDTTMLRHQDCLPKSDSVGTWQVVDGKCMVRIDIVFQGVQVSTADEEIEFKLAAKNQIRVEKRFPLFLAWGLYQKVEE